ncbi:MAG: class I SAM-dependent methyltransferase [Verrucomicrobia bacterium]|nr:class I SAM-dependent methyltransferase [Verrucomicrobiota bacterium]
MNFGVRGQPPRGSFACGTRIVFATCRPTNSNNNRPTRLRKTLNKVLQPTGYRIGKLKELPPQAAPLETFHSFKYLRHNARRLEHLASLQLPLAGKTVLEVGAGTGDHSHFFLDRGCPMLITEARADNLQIIQQRYPQARVQALDMERPQLSSAEKFDIVYCYGLLYHLADPARALEFMAQRCREMLLLETCVSFGDDLQIHLCDEDPAEPSQAVSGRGCRPTRPWIFTELRRHFPFVYLPRTQPWHEEFPLDWSKSMAGLVRAVFIGSRQRLGNPSLINHVPAKQVRH